MIRRVEQTEAKRGDFIDSFTDKATFDLACIRLERAAKARNIKREIVYIVLPVDRKTMWQVFLMP